MSSEPERPAADDSPYGPLYDVRPADRFDEVQERFAEASRPFFASPITWLCWAIVLPAAALLTPWAASVSAEPGVLLTWSLAILVGGLPEAFVSLRRGAAEHGRGAARWALGVQGNLSLVGVALSAVFLWFGHGGVLPGLWLLIIGHSFYTLGGLAFRPMRTSGIVYQLAGAAALWPGWPTLTIFAAATFVGNAWLAYSVWRR